jgi:hypothetical protein
MFEIYDRDHISSYCFIWRYFCLTHALLNLILMMLEFRVFWWCCELHGAEWNEMWSGKGGLRYAWQMIAWHQFFIIIIIIIIIMYNKPYFYLG